MAGQFLQSAFPVSTQREKRDKPGEYQRALREAIPSSQVLRYPNRIRCCPSKVGCRICDDYHLHFRYDHLHPLFHFIREADVCFKEYGSGLIMNLRMKSQAGDRIYRATQHAKRHVHITRILNENGITLGQALDILLKSFRLCVLDQHHHNAFLMSLANPDSIREVRQRGWRYAGQEQYPTPEALMEHFGQFPATVRRFDDAMYELDPIMGDVDGWKAENQYIRGSWSMCEINSGY
ncbi:hypothetical protein K458DRAFT_388352 [Lentithecium fluviatile CBS 122367]|uniref:Uncharacterized protein n=1 Tax=Lentithecium fluviatile CBS 122367 TaxID=1168545 RepID=A0A6G1J5S7_9PLEO|nr:hypothetical protein K458DRAFT_388352 [Lentithecium fluviatile CBS 122367]